MSASDSHKRPLEGEGKEESKAKRAKVEETLDEVLACPICFLWMCAPIYQCSRGHVVCETCKKKMIEEKKPCVCGNLDRSIRNLTLEKMAEKSERPCEDCGEVMTITKMRGEHKDKCPKGLKKCWECATRCSPSEMANHMVDAHAAWISPFDNRSGIVTSVGATWTQMGSRRFVIYPTSQTLLWHQRVATPENWKCKSLLLMFVGTIMLRPVDADHHLTTLTVFIDDRKFTSSYATPVFDSAPCTNLTVLLCPEWGLQPDGTRKITFDVQYSAM